MRTASIDRSVDYQGGKLFRFSEPTFPRFQMGTSILYYFPPRLLGKTESFHGLVLALLKNLYVLIHSRSLDYFPL